MGCDHTKTLPPESFCIETIYLDKPKITGQYKIKKKSSDIFDFTPDMKIFDYLQISQDIPIQNFFQKFQKDLTKLNPFLSSDAIFIFYFQNNKTPEIKEMYCTISFNPYNHYALNEESRIRKLSIFLIDNLKELGLDKRDLLIELEYMLINNNYYDEITGKILKLKSENLEFNESELDERKIEMEIDKGIFIR